VHRPFSLGLSLAPEILKIIAPTNRWNFLTNISLSPVIQLEGYVSALLILPDMCHCSSNHPDQMLLLFHNLLRDGGGKGYSEGRMTPNNL
jgi:hypothetical protein